MSAKITRVKKKYRKNIPHGFAHIHATFNNTIVTITDMQGNTIAWSSAGVKGFKGSKKSTPYVAQMAAEDAGTKAMEHGLQSVDIMLKGPGAGRETALRALRGLGLNVKSIKDITGIPFNGCRPPSQKS